jgi:hypothetical protein
MNNDILKKCIVRLEYKSTIDTDKFEGSGSGAIVHLDKKEKERDYFYIFTAKHTFFKDNINNEDMDESKINPNNISIFDFNNQEIHSKVLSIIGIDVKYDFLILVVEKTTYSLPKIPSLPIYEDDFKECKICGFPSSKKPDKNTSILFDCTYSMRDDVSDTYEVKSNTILTIDGANLNANTEISGLSGSGVFVESATGKPYLAGIQIQTASHNSLVCLDIRILAREINDALASNNDYLPIEIDGYALKDELGIDTSKIDFNAMLDKLKDDELDKFKDKSHKKLIEAFNGGIKQKLDEKSKELANKYLYLSLLFHKEKDNRRSTIYFKKAVKHNPSYYALFLKAKDERDLTEKEKEKYHEINSEVSNSDISADDLFLEMLDDKLKKLKDSDEKEGVYIQMIKLLETQLRELKSGQDFDMKKELIMSKSIELFQLYLNKNKLDDADKLLLDLKEKKYSGIDEYLSQLYINQDFQKESASSKQELSKRYLELLDIFKEDGEKFPKLKEQLTLLYDDKTDRVTSELNSVKKQIKKYEEQINSLEDMFTKYIKEEKVLNKVDEVHNQLKKSHTKLDDISSIISRNHDVLIQVLLNGIIESNKELMGRVQKIYYDSNTNEKLVQTLNSIITYMNQRVKKLPIQSDKQLDIKGIEKIIKECNFTLYKGIKKLYEKNTDSSKDDLFRKSLAVAEKRHQEHLVSLKKSLEEQREDIVNFKIQLKKLNQWLDEITEKYNAKKVQSIEFEDKILELKEENILLETSFSKTNNGIKDSIDLERYKLKIEHLEKELLLLEGKSIQIDDLKNSIALSSKTAETLVSLEKTNRDKLEIYLEKIEQKYGELDSEKKNLLEENFSEILKNINSSIDTLSYEPLDKEDFEGILIHLDSLDESINNINKKSSSESSEETKKSLELLNNIQGIESNYKLNQEEYFRKIEKFHDEIQNKVSENKLDKILVKHLNRIEEEISEIKEKGHLDNDVLFRLDSQLQQIQDYLPKKRSVIERLDYCSSIPRGIVVGGIILVGLIVLLLNKPILL